MTSPFPKAYADIVQCLRVPAGFLILGGFALLAHPSWLSLSYGAPVILLGLALRGWAAGHLQKNESLTVSGPYAYTRNPLYLGSAIAAVGFAVAANSALLVALLCIVFSLIYVPVMLEEAKHLTAIFPLYREYASRVPVLIPRLTKPGGLASSQAFSWTLFRRNKEQKAWYGAIAGLALLFLKMQVTATLYSQ